MAEIHLLASSFPFRDMIPNWLDFLHLSTKEELWQLKRHEKTGSKK